VQTRVQSACQEPLVLANPWSGRQRRRSAGHCHGLWTTRVCNFGAGGDNWNRQLNHLPTTRIAAPNAASAPPTGAPGILTWLGTALADCVPCQRAGSGNGGGSPACHSTRLDRVQHGFPRWNHRI